MAIISSSRIRGWKKTFHKIGESSMATPTCKKIFPFGMAASLLVALSLPAVIFGQVPDQEAVQRGKLVYDKYGCFVCHGNEGSGGVKNKNAATGGMVTALTFTSRAFNDAAVPVAVIFPILAGMDFPGL
jgi:mono/diheme cytochrome c family protein